MISATGESALIRIDSEDRLVNTIFNSLAPGSMKDGWTNIPFSANVPIRNPVEREPIYTVVAVEWLSVLNGAIFILLGRNTL